MPADLIDRARAYVAKMPAAVSGQDGHGATFAVARVLVHFFELPIEEARTVLTEFNGRCSPPWSAKELNHKLQSALKSKWEGPRARDKAQNHGRPLRRPRTDRIGFSHSVLPPEQKKVHSRMLRMDFLDSFVMRAGAQAHGGQTASAEKPSVASVAEERAERETNTTRPPASDAPEPDSQVVWKGPIQLRRTSETLPPSCTWIARNGAAWRCRRAETAIEIGQQIAQREAHE